MNPIVLIALTLSCGVFASETPGSRSCPGGYRHGDTYESGRYWYGCKDGQAIPRGCLSDTGRRVEVQDTYDTQDTRMQCVLDADGYLTVLYKSCVYQGREYTINEKFDDGKVVYKCKKDGQSVRVVSAGCVFEGRHLAFDERAPKDEFVYSCRKGNFDSSNMVISGCYKDGRKHTIGDAYDSGNFVYTCTDQGGKVTGCFHNGQRFMDNDEFHQDDTIFKCVLNGDQTALKPVGCIQRENGVETEKVFGCFWTEGGENYQYEMTCKLDEQRNVAVKWQLRCQYKGPEGVFRLEGGCFHKGNGMSVGCIRDSSGQLQTRVFSSEKPDSGYGLREC